MTSIARRFLGLFNLGLVAVLFREEGHHFIPDLVGLVAEAVFDVTSVFEHLRATVAVSPVILLAFAGMFLEKVGVRIVVGIRGGR